MVEAAIQYGTMVASLKDGITMAAKAFKLNAPQLDPGRSRVTENMTYKRPPSEAFNIQNPHIAMVADAVGTLVNLPGRMMMTMDEFVKQISYRGEVRSKAYVESECVCDVRLRCALAVEISGDTVRFDFAGSSSPWVGPM